MSSAHPTDGWVACACGQRHWGRHGAAGLLLHRDGEVVLQHRAGWSHHGGTWALPGGALLPQESAVTGALRESAEEAGIAPDDARPRATWVLRHPDWSYTTVLADAVRPVAVRATDPEGVEVRWVPAAQVEQRDLLPAFADAWPALRRMLDVRPVVVVDAANVVGSRPDGWWRDRAGAAARLVAGVERLAADGVPASVLDLPGERWWPSWHVVLEGAARGAARDEQGRPDDVVVHAAPASGDDAIVTVVEELTGDVVVATADRGLRARVAEAGARAIGPGALRALLDG